MFALESGDHKDRPYGDDNGGRRTLEEGSEKKASGLMDLLGRFMSGRKKVTEEEIQELMDAGEEEGIINEEENGMIRAIFTLRDTVVREIMVPRTDMACVSADATVSEVLATIIGCGQLLVVIALKPAPEYGVAVRPRRRARRESCRT